MSQDPQSLPLNYAPARRTGIHRRVRRFWIALAIILAVSAAAWQLYPRVARYIYDYRINRLERRCLDYVAPPDMVIYDDDPSTFPSLLGKPDYWNLKTGAGHMPPAWYAFRRVVKWRWGTQPGKAVASLHRRRSPSGNARLVVVEVTDRLTFQAQVITPGTRSASPSVGPTPFRTELSTSHSPVRIFAGQCHPSDSSRFTIDFTIGSRRGRIYGWLRDDDSVAMSPTIGYLSPGNVWYPEGYAEYTSYSDKPVGRLQHSDLASELDQSASFCITFSRSGRMLAVGGPTPDQTVTLFDVPSQKQIARLGNFNTRVHSMQFSPGDDLLAIDHPSGTHLWDIGSQTELRVLEHAHSPVFWPDGATIFTTDNLGWACQWNVNSGEMERRLDCSVRTISRDGVIMARTIRDGPSARHLQAMSTVNLNELFTVPYNGGHICITDDRRVLIIKEDSRCIAVTDAATKRELFRRYAVRGLGMWRAVAVSPDGRFLAAIASNIVHLWSFPAGEFLWELQGHTADLRSLTFSPDSALLATVDRTGLIALWDTRALAASTQPSTMPAR